MRVTELIYWVFEASVVKQTLNSLRDIVGAGLSDLDINVVYCRNTIV